MRHSILFVPFLVFFAFFAFVWVAAPVQAVHWSIASEVSPGSLQEAQTALFSFRLTNDGPAAVNISQVRYLWPGDEPGAGMGYLLPVSPTVLQPGQSMNVTGPERTVQQVSADTTLSITLYIEASTAGDAYTEQKVYSVPLRVTDTPAEDPAPRLDPVIYGVALGALLTVVIAAAAYSGRKGPRVAAARPALPRAGVPVAPPGPLAPRVRPPAPLAPGAACPSCGALLQFDETAGRSFCPREMRFV